MTDLNKCKCIIAPIVRLINFKVMYGAKSVFLDEFKDKLNSQDSLTKHGFKGEVKQVDDFIIYGE